MTTLESASVKKLISDLAAEGFSFHEDFDEINEYRFGKLFRRRRLENVVFEKEGVVIKIHNEIFFRATGIYLHFDESLQKPVKVSEEEFYETQKHLILYRYEYHLKNFKITESPHPTTVVTQSQQ